MQKIFHDTQLNSAFNQNGFVRVKLLSAETIREIRTAIASNYLNQLAPGDPETLHISLWSDQVGLKRYADDLIKSYLAAPIKQLLAGYEPIWGDILIKKPHWTRSFGLHQDWTFVDEDQYTSINAWCPLQPVHFWNGNLQVVRGSHRFLDKVRGLNIRPSYHRIADEVKKKYAENVPVALGEVVLFSHALLHASSPNRSFHNRLAIGLNFKPVASPILHYLLNTRTRQLEKYRVPADYFHTIGQNTNFAHAVRHGFTDFAVGGELLETLPAPGAELNMVDFERLYAAAR